MQEEKILVKETDAVGHGFARCTVSRSEEVRPMLLLQGAIHIFTETPDAAAQSMYNGLCRQAASLTGYERAEPSALIRYPHAVSCFCRLNLSYGYIAESYAKRKKAPVLVSIVGEKSDWGREPEQALRLYWSDRGKPASQVETFSRGSELTVCTGGTEPLKGGFSGWIPDGDRLLAMLGTERPLSLAEKLSDALGVFLGGAAWEAYVKNLERKRETSVCTLYESQKKYASHR